MQGWLWRGPLFALLLQRSDIQKVGHTHLAMTSQEMLTLSLKMGVSPSSSSSGSSSSSSTHVGLWTSFIKTNSNTSLTDTHGSKKSSLWFFPLGMTPFLVPAALPSRMEPGSNHPSSLLNVPPNALEVWVQQKIYIFNSLNIYMYIKKVKIWDKKF